MLIYRGESRFDLKGTAPVKLPLILTGQAQITCLVQCKQKQKTWSQAGLLEQFAFFGQSGMTTLQKVPMTFDDNQLIGLFVMPQSFLRFTPAKWLNYRTNISIWEIEQ